MAKKVLVILGLFFLLAPATLAQKHSGPEAVECRVMEVFVAEQIGAAAIFHQRDKVDGPRLGELLLAHSGAEMEFRTSDGKWHRATIFRVKSCFGRGLLVFAASEAKLGEKDEFVLRFLEK